MENGWMNGWIGGLLVVLLLVVSSRFRFKGWKGNRKKKPTTTKFEYGNISQPASIGFLGGVAVSGINQTDRRQGLNAVY